jgi:GntP family gluconate:H+ symporter
MPSVSEFQLIAASVAAIGLSIWLIVKADLHPIIGLLCGAFVLGLLSGMSPQATAAAVQKGFGDVLGGTGIVIALGLTLGAMLQYSGAASALAGAALRVVGVRFAPWGSLFAAMVIGLPLFFETGAVLLLPIVAAAVAKLPVTRGGGNPTLRLMLPAVAGLSVLHALLPPHPGPLLAIHELGANLGRTMLYGLVVAIPTAIIAGPVFARFAARHLKINVDTPVFAETHALRPPHLLVGLLVVMLPVVLISLSVARDLLPASPVVGWLFALGNPVLALLIANLVGLVLLFRHQPPQADTRPRIWNEAMKPAGTFLLSIGAGGALKQVLVSAGMADAMVRFAGTRMVSPLILAWAIAVLIRVATGSATVATITAAGVMSGVVTATGASPEWVVLAIGAGSVFFSHVNDAGFWQVKAYLGINTADTFKTWSVLETIISVVGLLSVMLASRFF